MGGQKQPSQPILKPAEPEMDTLRSHLPPPVPEEPPESVSPR